jgi:aspartate/methionine/tyrosine aminotransferase
MSIPLPDFRLEVHFARWEFTAEHNLAASDAESMTIAELLALAGREPGEFASLGLGYGPVEGSVELREAIAAGYEHVEADDVLTFAGAEEVIFWAMQLLVEPGEHAVMTVPNYQSMESVAAAHGARLTGLPVWSGGGDGLRWELDLDRFEAALRPETRLVAVNFPNNPTGFVPPRAVFEDLIRRCDDRSIRVLSDEVYRGVELEPARTLDQAADLSETAVSVGVMSKAYGLPGLRVGWVACRDRELLGRLARAKHYTTICNAVPSEYLAALALQHADVILARTRAVITANLPLFEAFFADYPDLFEWAPPDGGCVAFPRYLGPDGVEAFCRRAVEEAGVILLPASLFASGLAEVPTDRFRVGVGRHNSGPALDALRTLLPR